MAGFFGLFFYKKKGTGKETAGQKKKKKKKITRSFSEDVHNLLGTVARHFHPSSFDERGFGSLASSGD